MLSVLMMVSVCFATPQVVTLSIEAWPNEGNPGTGTFQVFASVTNDGSNYGISAFELLVTPVGSISLTSIVNEAPYNGTYGFWSFRDAVLNEDGTGYVSAAQQTIYGNSYVATKDTKVYKRVGQSAGSSGGGIFVDKPAASTGFSLLKNVTGTGWKGPGNEMAPNQPPSAC